MKIIRTFLVISALHRVNTLSAQQENWDVYLAQYEKGPGSTVINMGIRQKGPDNNLPFLISAGVKFKGCDGNGLPIASEFDNLSRISDSIAATINRIVKNVLVGTFTYQCERRDYFYVADTSDLRRQTTQLISNHYPQYTSAVNIKYDKEWSAYFDFLYPNEETMEYMQNEKVISQLQKSGDKLEKERQVDHWLYFGSQSDRDCFISYAKQNHYKIESLTKENQPDLPYKLQLSRIDKVNLSAITRITLELRKQAKKCNGNYDGWETFVIK